MENYEELGNNLLDMFIEQCTEPVMTREETIENLQDYVEKNYIVDFEGLEREIKASGYELEPIDDVLAPIEYNVCDRCGGLAPSYYGLNWVDYLNENAEDYEDVLRGIEIEGEDICAFCDTCFNALTRLGRKDK